MYRKTVDELQNDQREKAVIDIRSEEDYTKETYPGRSIFSGKHLWIISGDTEGSAGVSVLLYRTEK